MPETILDSSTHIVERTKDFTGREWVFRAIDDWLGDPHRSRVFFLIGAPGSGRSSIAARLVEMSHGGLTADEYPFLGPGTLTFAHFCQALQDSTLSPLRFIENLSQQLARRHQPFARALTQMDEHGISIRANITVGTAKSGAEIKGITIESLHIGDLPVPSAFDRLVRRPLEQLCTPDFEETILILVNAVDEAMTYGAEQNILTLIRDAVDHPRDLPPQVRFLLTSRADARVTRGIIDYESLDLLADAPDDIDDVQAYACRRLAILAEPKRTQVAKRVANVAQGNFLYARYVLNDLLSNPGQLEDPSGFTLPEGLNDVYRQFLREDLGRSQGRWQERYRVLLGTLAVVRGQGLTRKQLAGITGLSQSQADSVLRASAQYLIGFWPDGPFRLYHQSFRQFLLLDEQYQVYPGECNQAIAEYFLDEYKGGWRSCEDDYALRYTPAHLMGAIHDAPSRRWRQPLLEALCSLLNDPEFLEARSKRVGVETLLADLEIALGMVRDECQARPELEVPLRTLEEVVHSLRRETGRDHM
jgi:hypothetical protein